MVDLVGKVNDEKICVVCGEKHFVYRCSVFLNESSVERRFNLIKNKNVCYNCLNVGHFSKDCDFPSCKNFKDAPRHNKYLCRAQVNVPVNAVVSNETESGDENL